MPSLSSLAPTATRQLPHSTREVGQADLLRKEFGSPFAIVDAIRMTVAHTPADFPGEIDESSLQPLVRRVATNRAVEICDGPGSWLLVGLPLWKSDEVGRVAVGVFRRWHDHESDDAVLIATTAASVRSGVVASIPPHCLERWAQAVADRQRLNDKLRSKARQCDALEQQLAASSKMLQVLDRLAGRLRLSDRPDKFQKCALTSLFETLSAECVAWVPASPHDSVMVVGQSAIEADRIRRVVLEALTHADPAARRSFIENHASDSLWAFQCPTLRSITIVCADEDKPSGWLVAINKTGAGGFCANDTELMRPVASLLNVFRKNMNLYVDLKELLFGVVRSLTSAIDAKDPYTRGHSERVARVAVCVGRQMGLGTDELSNLYLAGLLHDVGKIGVEDQVLKKTDRLTPAEYRHVMSHVEIGVSILRELKRLRHVLPGILHHHERFEGGGYPDGIRGDEIPLIARILAVADSFDAMNSDRPYRSRRSSMEVETILRDGASHQWDPKAIEAALSCWPELCAIQHRGIGESLRVAVDDALHQDYSGLNDSKHVAAAS